LHPLHAVEKAVTQALGFTHQLAGCGIAWRRKLNKGKKYTSEKSSLDKRPLNSGRATRRFVCMRCAPRFKKRLGNSCGRVKSSEGYLACSKDLRA